MGKYFVPCIGINHSKNKKIPKNDTTKEINGSSIIYKTSNI